MENDCPCAGHLPQPEKPALQLWMSLRRPTLLVSCGVFDFAEVSACDAELALRVRRAIGLLDAHGIEPADNVGDAGPVIAFNTRLIGRKPAFMKMLRRVAALASSDASVLLTGETGTGKEVCAQGL